MVGVMRELGVVQCDGITLGPEPTKLQALEFRAKETPDLVDLTELEAERQKQRLAEARQDIRDKVGADLTDAQCDRFIRAEALS